IPLITSLISNLVFIPGDCIKAILTVLIVRRLRKEGGFEMYFRK
ncbi:MAG: biotin transporter BioY, partial [Lactococcus lactis]|nr:biotin transporter BioY [Lactococcus lactis]